MMRILMCLWMVCFLGGCTFEVFCEKFNGVGFWLLVFTIVMVIIRRVRHPEKKLTLGFKKRKLKL
jgi:hypothetical protein